jgi:hypothetical protein
MNDETQYQDLHAVPTDEKTCGCGPDCRCGPDCNCGPSGKCAPACACGD